MINIIAIKDISVIGTDENYTVFGLGEDSVPYVWTSEGWTQVA